MSFRETKSRGACRGFYTFCPESGTRGGAPAASAHAPLSAERLRTAFPAAAVANALLQRGVPARGADLVTLESTAELSRHEGRKRQAQPAKPALSGTRPEGPGGREERRREGNHSKLFSTTPAIDPAATRDFCIGGEVPHSASVRAPAAAPWNEYGSANDAGARPPISRTY